MDIAMVRKNTQIQKRISQLIVVVLSIVLVTIVHLYGQSTDKLGQLEERNTKTIGELDLLKTEFEELRQVLDAYKSNLKDLQRYTYESLDDTQRTLMVLNAEMQDLGGRPLAQAQQEILDLDKKEEETQTIEKEENDLLEEKLTSAFGLFRSGDYAGAVKGFTEIIEQDSALQGASYFYRGRAYIELGRQANQDGGDGEQYFNESISDFDHILNMKLYEEIGLTPSLIDRQRAIGLRESGRLDEALTIFNSLLQGAPENSSYYLSRGLLYIKKGSIEMAKSDFENSVKYSSPESLAGKMENLALVSIFHKDGKKTLAIADEALALNPELSWSHAFNCIGYNLLEQSVEAKRWCESWHKMRKPGELSSLLLYIPKWAHDYIAAEPKEAGGDNNMVSANRIIN